MFGGFFSWFNYRKRWELIKSKDKMQSKSAMGEDYKRAKARKKRKKK